MVDVTRDAVLEHIIARIDEVFFNYYPFRHLFIHPFWPDDIYEMMMQEFPKSDAFVRRDSEGWQGKSRVCTHLSKRSNIWALAQSVLEASEFAWALCAKFGLQLHHGDASQMLLHEEYSGFMIAPHIDHPSKRITYLCYFPERWRDASEGTLLLKSNLPQQQGARVQHQKWYDFHIAKIASYIPNTFAAFAPSDGDTWHAVDVRFPIGGETQTRRTVRGFIFEHGTQRPLLFEEDMRERECDTNPRT